MKLKLTKPSTARTVLLLCVLLPCAVAFSQESKQAPAAINLFATKNGDVYGLQKRKKRPSPGW